MRATVPPLFIGLVKLGGERKWMKVLDEFTAVLFYQLEILIKGKIRLTWNVFLSRPIVWKFSNFFLF